MPGMSVFRLIGVKVESETALHVRTAGGKSWSQPEHKVFQALAATADSYT